MHAGLLLREFGLTLQNGDHMGNKTDHGNSGLWRYAGIHRVWGLDLA